MGLPSPDERMSAGNQRRAILSKSNKPTTRLDRQIESSIKDEIRIDLLRILIERSATPRELAQILEEDSDLVLDHVVALWAANCIELAGEEKPRGEAIDRSYRMTLPFFIDDRECHDLSRADLEKVAAMVVQAIVTEAVGALRAGTFGSRIDSHLSIRPMRLDARGWREFTALLLRTLNEAETIEEGCRERLGREEGIEAIVALMGFERSESRAG